ncbi:hypothetical protein D3C79_608190 [compost metagenome]
MVGQALHQGRRIEQHGIGGINGRVVEAGAEPGRERGRIQMLILLVQQIQFPGILRQQPSGPCLDGAVILAALLPVAVNTVAIDPLRQLGEPPLQKLPVVAGLGQLGGVAADVVRQIDGESRIAPCRIVAHHPRLQQHDAGLWSMLGQGMGKRQPGITRPHDDPVRLNHLLQTRAWRPLGQDGGPAVDLVTLGDITDLHIASCLYMDICEGQIHYLPHRRSHYLLPLHRQA